MVCDGFEARARGALLGCALGDAMGMPTEMMSRADIAELFPGGVRGFSPATGRDVFGRSLAAGEVTDDTVNTVLVARMLVECGGRVDVGCYLDLLRGWMAENPDKARFVAGPSTLRALDALDRGEPIERAGVFGTTNGGAMKISPVGVVYDWRDSAVLLDAVEALLLPTHNTGAAIACAAAAAAAVSYGVRGGSEVGELWDVAIRAAACGEARGYSFPCASVVERLEAARGLVGSAPEDEVVRRLCGFFGTGVESVETAPAVFAVVALSGGDAHEAACRAASLGGDTDTIGAIAGAVCGAMRPETVGEEDAETLSRVNGIDFGALAACLVRVAR